MLAAHARALFFPGNNVECTCCGLTFSRFLYSPYMTARCPYCMSIERYRLLCKFLVEEMRFGQFRMRFLDIAPLWCFQLFCRQFPEVEYVSVDIRSPLADYKMDIQSLQFDDESFDAVLCYHVLEHVPDDRKAIREIFRVLKRGGWALVQVPIEAPRTKEREEMTPYEIKNVLRWDDHLRSYGTDFFDRLREAGFVLKESDFVTRLPKEDIERFGLDLKERITICTKPS